MSEVTEKDNIFHWEDDGWGDNTMVVSVGDGRLTVVVAQEHAVDSYNETFNCEASLTIEEAKRLRDFLVKNLQA